MGSPDLIFHFPFLFFHFPFLFFSSEQVVFQNGNIPSSLPSKPHNHMSKFQIKHGILFQIMNCPVSWNTRQWYYFTKPVLKFPLSIKRHFFTICFFLMIAIRSKKIVFGFLRTFVFNPKLEVFITCENLCPRNIVEDATDIILSDSLALPDIPVRSLYELLSKFTFLFVLDFFSLSLQVKYVEIWMFWG